MAGLWQPHDSFFKALMEQRRAVTARQRERLPPELVAQLADTPPELVDGSFVDGELRGSISDRLFRLKLRGKGEAFVYCVLEHKSSPEPRVALNLEAIDDSELSNERTLRARGPRSARTRALASSSGAGLYGGDVPKN